MALRRTPCLVHFYYVARNAIGKEKREKGFNASIVFLTCCEKNGSMKMDFNISLYARRGEKLTRRKTQENLKLNFHS